MKGTELDMVSDQSSTSCSFTHLAERQFASITGLENGQEKGKAVNRGGTTNCADKILAKEHRFEESPEGIVPHSSSPSLSLDSPRPSSAVVESRAPQAVCLDTLVASPVKPSILLAYSGSDIPEIVDVSRAAGAAAGRMSIVLSVPPDTSPTVRSPHSSISQPALPIPRGPDHRQFHRYSHVPWLHLLRSQEQHRKPAWARRPPLTQTAYPRSLTVL